MAGYERREFPEFSWSHSRDRQFTECKQAYFLRYYASHNGWERGAPLEARQAWTLGKLVSVPSALGMAVHECAVQCATAVAAGEPLPAATVLVEQVRATLNTLRLRRDVGAFRAAPKLSPMLHEIYYHGRIDPAVVVRTREKVERCIQHLVTAPFWCELRTCLDAGGEMKVVDATTAFRLRDVTLFAAPDLAFRHAGGARPVIVDWKTGRLDATADQVAVYGLLLRDHLGWAPHEGRYGCRVIGLDEGHEEVFDLTAEDLADAEQRVVASVSRMRGILADPARNVAKTWEHYPLAWGKARCRFCPYREVCEARIAAEIRARSKEVAWRAARAPAPARP